MKIGIIGLGWVGSSVAISTLHTGVARTLLLHDVKPGLAEGEAMDLAHGAPFYPSARVEPAEVEDMRDADAVVFAAGRGGVGDESRLALAKDNAAIARSVATRLEGFEGLLIVLTNPVDVLTQVMTEASGLPRERVLGTGTMLDTARLRETLGRRLGLEARSVHAQVIGEHGDSEVCVWSSAQVGGVPLRRYVGWKPEFEPEVATSVRQAAYEIIRRKGATNHAIGLVAASLLESSLAGADRVLNVSMVQDGAFGIRDVALSLPTVVGRHGAKVVLEPDLDDEELEGLHRSADVLRAARADVG